MVRKTFRIIALFLLIICLAGLISCDLIGGKPKKRVNKPATGQKQIQDNIKPSSESSTESQNENAANPGKDEGESKSNSSSPGKGYGRDNPFAPLIVSRSAPPPPPPTPEPDNKKKVEVKEISIRLTSMIGNIALFQVDGVRKPVSKGNVLTEGLELMDIRGSEAVLGKGNEKYTLKVGEELKIKSSVNQ